MKTNVKYAGYVKTHEGALTPPSSSLAELRRTVMSNMLFENGFYESGIDCAVRIRSLIGKVSFEEAADIAIEAREKMKLRHVPLLIVRELLRNHSGRKVGDLVFNVIQRPDEMGELLALYWKENKNAPLSVQLKMGLARAFKKFNEYQLSKWNKDGAVKLRDVLFLCHVKPDNEEQAALFKRVAENQLVTPDTWEVALSSGADKKETFTRLISEKKLGALALLRNLRGMLESNVPDDIIRSGIESMSTERVLPFRFISAARYAPRFEDVLESAMFKCLADVPKLSGKTALLIDHSGSMNDRISSKSDISRFDAACGLAMILRECAERVRFFAFSDHTVEVSPRRGFALREAAENCMSFCGTSLGQAVRYVYSSYPECDRIIVITDEQSSDRPPQPQGKGYIINVASNKNGIGYGSWVTIDGWSEAVFDYIKQSESISE